MVIATLSGGLGNQMFQYAAALGLARRRETRVGLDCVSYLENQPEGDTRRKYELSSYELDVAFVGEREIRALYRSAARTRVWNRFLPAPRPSPVFREVRPGYAPEFFDLPGKVLLIGYWQDERYFVHVRRQLLEDFAPRELSDQTKELARELAAGCFVALHVRRGDYVSDPETSTVHGVLDAGYYRRAIELIGDTAGDIRCLVFSDDPEWCERSLDLGVPTRVVTGNAARPAEDIYLMSQCAHAVVANSSFGWWGAWLNQSPGQIVVAPRNWVRDEATNEAMTIVPERWLRI
jgi:hypothetical protein